LAYRWKKFFGRNPVSESGLLEVHNQVERILTPEEEERLLTCIPLHLKPIIITALNTGMRKGEILSLRWEDIDLESNLITIRQEVSKSEKTRRIPINTTLRKLLLEQRLKSGGSLFVFLNSEDHPYKRHDSVKGAFERT
jgi:integrase